MNRIPLGLAFALSCATAVYSAPVPRSTPAQVQKELDAAWIDLLSPNELTASSAVLRCAARPEEVVSFLKAKLQPLKLTKERVTELISDLGSEEGKVARTAFAELALFDPRLALAKTELEEAMIEKPASKRLGAILCDMPIDAFETERFYFNSPDNEVFRFSCGKPVRDRDIGIQVAQIGTVGQKATWNRMIRAIAVLEFIGSPDARTILKELATGHPDASPTKAAKKALEQRRW